MVAMSPWSTRVRPISSRENLAEVVTGCGPWLHTVSMSAWSGTIFGGAGGDGCIPGHRSTRGAARRSRRAPCYTIRSVHEQLAIHGGPRAKRSPFGGGKRHGEREKQLLSEVIDSQALFYFIGTKVFDFQRAFARMYGRKHCVACSSGTAAVHLAVGALELSPGTEVITSAITDMGTLTGMLYQGLIPGERPHIRNGGSDDLGSRREFIT